MKIEYTKSYSEKEFNYFTLYGQPFNNTAVFYEYYKLVRYNNEATEKELIEKIKNYVKESRSNLRISYSEKQIEFFKPNKYIFPIFYVIFK